MSGRNLQMMMQAVGFSPASISGLTVWLDASQETAYVDSDPVGTATDFSGNGNDATQATAAHKPLFKTNVLNGLPSFRFDGADDGLLTPTLPGTVHDGEFAILAVWRNAATGGNIIYETPLASWVVNGGLLLYTGVNTTAFIRNTSGTGYSGYDIATDWGGDNVWRVSSHVANHTHASHALYLNGQVPSPWTSHYNTDPGSTQNSHQLSIGCRDAGGTPAYPMQGDLTEFLVYDRFLTTTERQSLEDYLGAKYGIAITH